MTLSFQSAILRLNQLWRIIQFPLVFEKLEIEKEIEKTFLLVLSFKLLFPLKSHSINKIFYWGDLLGRGLQQLLSLNNSVTIIPQRFRDYRNRK